MLLRSEMIAATDDGPPYPQRPNRYFSWGINQNSQDCYTDEDVRLLNIIQEKYKTLPGAQTENENPFAIVEEKQWYDWWICRRPANYNAATFSNSFTLPNREPKDPTFFPLWNFAENMARLIANQESKRIKGQNLQVMNDPVMLVFRQLRNLFFYRVAFQGCKKEYLEDIAQQQSYIMNIMHAIPNFGPDRLFLLEVHNRLQKATDIITSCVANKQLPQLLSDIIIKTESIINTIGTDLQFLVDQEVAANFSPEFIEENPANCNLSPICIVNQNARNIASTQVADNYLAKFLDFNKFFNFKNVQTTGNIIEARLGLKENLLKGVHFPDFTPPETRQKYLYAIAALESLIKVGDTLQNSKRLQADLGTYIFAAHHLQPTNLLADNYEKLVDKIQLLIEDLRQSANNGLKYILKNPNIDNQRYEQFQKNRALVTLFFKDTTASKLLQEYCNKAKASMRAYQSEMQKLVLHLNTGKAAQTVNRSMQNLGEQIIYINSFLPAQLDSDGKFELDKSPPQQSISGSKDTSINSINHSAQSAPLILERSYQHFSVTKIDEPHAINHSLRDMIKFGAWASVTKYDFFTGQPIFTYRVFSDTGEIGSIEVLGGQLLYACNDTQNNIVKLEGVLAGLPITLETSIEDICAYLPPSLFDRVLFASTQGAFNGFLRGSTNMIGVTLQSRGMSETKSVLLSRFLYYCPIFTMNFYSYYQQFQEEQQAEACLSALLNAAISTGTLALLDCGLTTTSALLDRASKSLESSWSYLSKGIKFASYCLRFGLFAYAVADKTLPEISANLLTSTAAQIGTEYVGNKIIRRGKLC